MIVTLPDREHYQEGQEYKRPPRFFEIPPREQHSNEAGVSEVIPS